jgi:predicted RNA-binding Zn-ribbon protein involved in translation (DUF1610 family)
MTFQTKSEKWITVAQQLIGNRALAISCPFCGKGTLKVIDVPFSPELQERWISCPDCKEVTALRMSNSAAPKS